MKDQRKLLNSCLNNEIPAGVFQGTDNGLMIPMCWD